MGRILLQLDNVVKSLGGRRVLDGLHWHLNEGDCAVILGPSGSGKSVFLHTLLGFHPPDAGRVSAPGLTQSDLFGSIAVMFQEDALLEERTVEANLAVAVEERPDRFVGPFAAQTERAIDDALREVQLDPARVRKALPSSLSGGMRRRLALARALIRRPAVLIADEPTTGLDPATAAGVYDLLAQLLARRGMSAVIITHDPACASRLGYPVYYFSPAGGRMPQWEPPAPDAPRDERHRSLLLWMHEQIARHLEIRTEKPAALDDPAQSPPIAEPLNLDPTLLEKATAAVDALGRVGLLLGSLFRPPNAGLLARDLLAWGLGTVPLMTIIFLMVGVVMEIQAEAALVAYGLSNQLPELVALSLLRLSPILIGFLMAGRCGSAISAQIGWMQLGGQFRALRTMRIEPNRALFPPLLWSLAAATPLLALAGLLVGIAGSSLILASPVSRAEITVQYFVSTLPRFLKASELLVVVAKGMLMGAGLALIAYAGAIRPKRSPDDVTASITRGLVSAFLWITLVDTILSLLFPMS